MKEKLLEVVAEARAREDELAGAATDVPADPDGRWHAKDHLAHAAWWRDRDGRLITAVRTGAAPPPPLGSREAGAPQQGDGGQNAVIYGMYRHRSSTEIRAFAENAWDTFTEAVAACTEDDLKRPHPYVTADALWQTALGICYHTGEHLTYWWQEAGDSAKVDAAQRWLRDIYVAVAPDAKGRANADYNLACYYVRSGRVDEALAALRRSLTASADLKAWARQDSDLDPIREEPELKELLAT